jgi:Immunity protein 51
MNTDFEPCNFLEHEGGGKSLFFSDFGFSSEVLEDKGGQGGGHSWESIVKAVIEIRGIKLQDLEFDSEGDMFCALSRSTESLSQVAAIVRELFSSSELMTNAIDKAIKEGYFE